MGFLETVRAKLEISKLEKRYAQRHRRRTAYEASAQYADGEYTYTTVAPTAFSSPKFATTITTTAAKRQSVAGPPSAASTPRTFPSLPSAAERRRSYFGTPSKTIVERDFLSPTDTRPVEPRAASPSYAFGRQSAERSNVLVAHWENAKARMPSVKVTEVFGGGAVKTSQKLY